MDGPVGKQLREAYDILHQEDRFRALLPPELLEQVDAGGVPLGYAQKIYPGLGEQVLQLQELLASVELSDVKGMLNHSLVPKSDGVRFRLVQDGSPYTFRGGATPDLCPQPSITVWLRFVASFSFIFELDLTSAFYQVPVGMSVSLYFCLVFQHPDSQEPFIRRLCTLSQGWQWSSATQQTISMAMLLCTIWEMVEYGEVQQHEVGGIAWIDNLYGAATSKAAAELLRQRLIQNLHLVNLRWKECSESAPELSTLNVELQLQHGQYRVSQKYAESLYQQLKTLARKQKHHLRWDSFQKTVGCLNYFICVSAWHSHKALQHTYALLGTFKQRPEDTKVIQLSKEVSKEWTQLIPDLRENKWCPLPVPPPSDLSEHRCVWITDASEQGFCCLQVDLRAGTTTQWTKEWSTVEEVTEEQVSEQTWREGMGILLSLQEHVHPDLTLVINDNLPVMLSLFNQKGNSPFTVWLTGEVDQFQRKTKFNCAWWKGGNLNPADGGSRRPGGPVEVWRSTEEELEYIRAALRWSKENWDKSHTIFHQH